jgi:septum formation protein
MASKQVLIKQEKTLILASSSVIRKKIMEEVGLKFEVIKPPFDEDLAKKNFRYKSMKELSMFLAEGKAISVSKKYPNAYVIGSDQVCEFAKKDISKSTNQSEAVGQLRLFNGKSHTQNNATVVALNGKIIFRNFSSVKMVMRKLSMRDIQNYVKIDQSWNCAGSYKYESLGKHLFSKVTGDYYCVLGLAIQPLLSFFHKKNIISFS